jgi:hypothetical protein
VDLTTDLLVDLTTDLLALGLALAASTQVTEKARISAMNAANGLSVRCEGRAMPVPSLTVICASDACPAFGVATSPWRTISKPRGHSLALQVY